MGLPSTLLTILGNVLITDVVKKGCFSKFTYRMNPLHKITLEEDMIFFSLFFETSSLKVC